MPYEILLADKALSRVPSGLPGQVLDELDAAFRRLGDSPITYGKRSLFPFVPRGQIYPFKIEHEGRTYHFVVYFYFSVDERAIKVFDVTYLRY
jgi:hypothetical protein